MLLHTEDLMSEDLGGRYAAVRDLAVLVGSSLTQEELCCLAQRDQEFMGSHQRDLWKNKNQAQVRLTLTLTLTRAQVDP